MQLANLNKPSKRKLNKDNLEHSLLEQYELVDTVMAVPISADVMVNICIYKSIDKLFYLDIREYHLVKTKWIADTGIKLPFSSLEQLLIRLQRLNSKYNVRI